MAMSDVLVAPGSPDVIHTIASSSAKLSTPSKVVQESLKRSFAKYLAADHAWDVDGLSSGKLFDPSKHLAFEEPKHIYTMEDIGYESTSGVSPVAVSEPFRLFTEDAVDIMRSEILDPEVVSKFSCSSDIAAKQIRGYAPT